MSNPPKAPPRFIPTLTEVVDEPQGLKTPAPAALKNPLNAQQGVARWREAEPALPPVLSNAKPQPRSQGVAPAVTPTARLLQPGFEEYVVHRVMQRVDVGLEQHLRDAIATVVQEQTRSLLPRLREEVESVVRHVVYEAVADELAKGEMNGNTQK